MTCRKQAVKEAVAEAEKKTKLTPLERRIVEVQAKERPVLVCGDGPKMSEWSQSTLNHKQRNAVLKALKTAGIRAPKVGWCVKALGGEVCRHPTKRMGSSDTGYQVISISKPAGFDAYRRRKARSR